MKSGKVYLVGAGPGDPGLITLKGVQCLEKADVIVYDRLLDDSLLERARPDAEKIFVGKASSDHTISQSQINRLLVEKAREGKHVIRLKGGDPFVFGRGGEEAAELGKNGITFEVIPGVTSAIAVPAYSGIPVTHRGLASSFTVITGHEDPAKGDSSINWDKLSTGADTLVFLMGMQNLNEIVKKLVEHGRSASTPAAVIKDGTRPSQRTVAGTLLDIVSRVKESGLTPPSIFIVREVVKLRETVRWFEHRPLFGKRVLVTMARHQASVLGKLLIEKGALPVELSAIAIRRIPDNQELRQAFGDLEQYGWTVFTSVNGVAAVFEELMTFKLDSRVFRGTKIAAIGPATLKALEARGIIADYCPSVYTTAGLIEGFRGKDIAGLKILLPRTDIADDELAKGLISMGAEVHEIAVYRTTPDLEAIAMAKEMLLSRRLDVVAFTSPSTVTSLVIALGPGGASLDGVKIACIGPKTAETARKGGLKPDIVAGEHTIPGLVDAIERLFRKVV
ncbi:MAG: uroporphyrinogen-III C-methyltransferase [Chloroflexi bacterium RBG_16_50_11]|nr:MAG: uroporphyrinogen-III C-methyltransferase [Chloroflexi bacterium RBG_16_50_11]